MHGNVISVQGPKIELILSLIETKFERRQNLDLIFFPYAGGICLTDYAEEIYLYITRSSVIWFVYGILLFCCWPLIDKKLFPYDDENKKAIDGPIERFAEWTKLRQSRPGTIFRLVSNSAASELPED